MTGSDQQRRARGSLVRGTVAGVSAAAVGAVAAASAAAHVARRVVLVESDRSDDVRVLAVDEDTVVLGATEDTVAPGRYGLWLEGGCGHARVGIVLSRDRRERTVTRRLDGIDRGVLRPGGARWDQYYFVGTPSSAFGLSFVVVDVQTDCGPMPAWVVPPPSGFVAGTTWAILVHGRGATREECLRALPLLNRLGMTVMVVSYRNDPDATRSPRGRYQLGDGEWVDLEAAVIHAVRGGAREVVLFGWSMGGAVVLQLVARSWVADRVGAVVLDAPVLDWRQVLAHQLRIRRLPVALARGAGRMLGHRWAGHLVGVDTPVSLDRLDWVNRAAELRVPVLVIHSLDDEMVPAAASQQLAAARPDLVTFVPVSGARHTCEWNVDPQGWEAAVATFLLRL